nr:DUF3830 family protein [Streptomyces cavernae]
MGCLAGRHNAISLVKREVHGTAKLLDDQAPRTCEAARETFPLISLSRGATMTLTTHGGSGGRRSRPPDCP